MRLIALVAALIATVNVSCGGSSSPPSTPTSATVADVQRHALQSLSGLTSGVVHVNGHVSQGTTSVDFSIEYRNARERFAYQAHSMFRGVESDVQVIGIPPRAWSLEDGTWKPLPTSLPLDSFRAERVWSFAPFTTSALVGKEEIGGLATIHYHYDGPVALSFGELAGSFIASGNVDLTGELDHMTIDYWVTQDGGLPVKASYKASGDGNLDLTADLTNANDPAIVVNAPP